MVDAAHHSNCTAFVKTDLARPPARYRNEAVFRSAELLIASTPKKAARKFPRWLVFAAGLLLGIGLTFVGMTFWRGGASPSSAVERVPSATTAKITSPGPTANGRANLAAATPPSTAAATVPTDPADTPSEQPDSSVATESAVDGARRTAPVASFTTAFARANLPAREASSYSVTGLTRFFADLTLRGQLLSDTAAPVSVEFTVRRLAAGDGNNLFGVVRFLNGNDQIAGNRLEGQIRDRTLTLRETKTLWTTNGRPFPVGRTFVIHLPEDPARDESKITGSWSFGSRGGTLVLTVAMPW